jgi:hypothetical protein
MEFIRFFGTSGNERDDELRDVLVARDENFLDPQLTSAAQSVREQSTAEGNFQVVDHFTIRRASGDEVRQVVPRHEALDQVRGFHAIAIAIAIAIGEPPPLVGCEAEAPSSRSDHQIVPR